ncbi:MAG: hypothetical protein H7840_02550 [Alphaproteobacteria bacterium]
MTMHYGLENSQPNSDAEKGTKAKRGSNSKMQSASEAVGAKRSARAANRAAAWPDVAKSFVDGVFGLARTGNIVGLIVAGIFITTAVLAVRMDEKDLPLFFYPVFVFLSAGWYTNVPLVLLIVYLIYALRRQKRLYEAETNRQVELRKTLIHGLDDGSLKILKKHNSSDTALGEDYVEH